MLCVRCGNSESSVFQCKDCGTMFCKNCAGSASASIIKGLTGIGAVGSKNQKCPECQSTRKYLIVDGTIIAEY